MTQEMTDWLLAKLDQDRTRLLSAAREAADAPGGRMVIRLAMDQVADIQSQLKIIEIARKALAEGDDPRFTEILAWLA